MDAGMDNDVPQSVTFAGVFLDPSLYFMLTWQL